MTNPATPTLVIGLGCQRGCPADVLWQLIEQSLNTYAIAIESVSALASIDQKNAEPGLLALAKQLELPLVFFSSVELAAFETRLSHRSALAFAYTGCYGVAESSALALAQRLGSGSSSAPSELLIPRQKNQQATFALAGSVANRR